MPDLQTPRYPELRVSTRSQNPLALVAAVREELRLAGAAHADIDLFTDQALAHADDRVRLRGIVEAWIGTVEAG